MLWLALLTVIVVVAAARLIKKPPVAHDISTVDRMDGLEFERYTAHLYANLGYKVKVTPASGDFGADVLTQKNGIVTALQCKRYSSVVGITAVQEVIGSLAYYKASKGTVITNNYFTDAAKELAKRNHIELIDREGLKKLIKKCNQLEE